MREKIATVQLLSFQLANLSNVQPSQLFNFYIFFNSHLLLLNLANQRFTC